MACKHILAALILSLALPAAAQLPASQSDPTIRATPLTTPLDKSQPTARFVAAHGRSGLLEGYATTGLEAWVYPFQLFKNYRPYFRLAGAKELIDASTLLTAIEYRPESVTRIYTGKDLQGADFTVREKLFVPIFSFGGFITYTVESKSPLLVEARLTPVMGLMWPADLGPSTIHWDDAHNALILNESTNGYSALIGSPQLAADSSRSTATTSEYRFILKPNASGTATLAWAMSLPKKSDEQSDLVLLYQSLIQTRSVLESGAADQYKNDLENILQIQTPDPAANQAILWSELALDQAWSCNPSLGCGFAAGYGPSRIERRPQYAWFFAGDGLVSANASLNAGDYSRVRDELEFILRHQDPHSGMIWHELTHSAPLLDWAGKYPYLFVHVDTTLDFINFVDQYVTQSGDKEFLQNHWPAIQSAYKYASSLVNPQTGLPQIPPDKEGGNEQARLSDDLGLSTSWVATSASYAHLASLMGDTAAAAVASTASARARPLIQTNYWSEKNSFWIAGHTPNDANSATGVTTAGGTNFAEQHSGPSSALDLDLFSPAAKEKILNRIASPDFLTTWGIRSVASNSPGYSPTLYAQGSVWPVGNASWALTYWNAHRSTTAFTLWHQLVALSSFDSPGHIHEVLQGSAPIPQAQSVPEQTWSSSSFLTATVRGLLGISPNALDNQLTFAPHLVTAKWPTLSLHNLRLGTRTLTVDLKSTNNSLELKLNNSGAPFHLTFSPELPRGARDITATAGDSTLTVTAENFPDSTTATLTTDIPRGSTTINIHFKPSK
jgi:glycogen debranching enzyme